MMENKEMKNDAKKLMEEYYNQVSSLMTEHERDLQEEYTFHNNYDVHDVSSKNINVSNCDYDGCCGCCLILLCLYAGSNNF